MEGDTAAFLRGLVRLRVTLDRSPNKGDVLALAATAAVQSVTPRILSSRGARARRLQRSTRLLQ